MGRATCKICGSKTSVLPDRQLNRIYHLCGRCDYISLDDRCRVPPAVEKRRYLEHNNTMANQGYVRMFQEFIAAAILPYRDRITTALDFGCGPEAVLAALLRREGWVVDIYDPFFAPEQVYRGKRYHLITATEVFEHLHEPLKTAALLKEHLAPQGILAIMTLFHPQDPGQFLNWWYRHDCTHTGFFTPRTFSVLAQRLKLRLLWANQKNICVLENAC